MPRPLPTYAEALLKSLLASAEIEAEPELDRVTLSNIRMHYLAELIHHLMQMLVARGYDTAVLIIALEHNLDRWRPKPTDDAPPARGVRRFLKR